MLEEKKPAVQVNLAELLKETGIADDDSFFMDDEPLPPPPQPQQPQQPMVQIQMDPPPIPAIETKENNVNYIVTFL